MTSTLVRSGSARSAAIWRWCGVGIGLVVACCAIAWGALGRGVLLAAPLFGLSVLLGVIAREASVRGPGGDVRQALLEVRRVGDYLPRRLGLAVAISGCTLFGLLLATTSMGSADDLGRAGRVLAHSCGASSQTQGPWPGSFYSVPLAIVVLVGALTAALALGRIVRRPRPQSVVTQTADDDAQRWRAAVSVTGACGVLVTIPLLGVCLITAAHLLAFECRPLWWSVFAWGLLASTPAWLGVLTWSTLTILPSGQRPPTVLS